ncbi:hypothetical protein H0H93_006098 [Arthromyces matolae]|nr:hypothetical protein H0H93_006098 [Arthromyces matolae]
MSTRLEADSSLAPLTQSMNSKKRSNSHSNDFDENSRSLKKPKTDEVQKKKKRKSRSRKRKHTVVLATESDSRARSGSTTVGMQDAAVKNDDVARESVPDEDTPIVQGSNDTNEEEDMATRIPYADKGKRKASKEPSPDSDAVESSDAQITRLKQELEAQRLLLSKHQSHLSQIHQALTCQICLDLLHKPFALAPCGHVACHPCLVRWFTAPLNPGGPQGLQEAVLGEQRITHYHKKKQCPVCRAQILERPVEVWGIKSMAATLARSGLVELPAPVPEPEPEASTSNNDDPWRDIFHRSNRGSFLDVLGPRPPRLPRPGVDSLQEMGMYDADDGGIYRCIDCMHEIWGGICTNCEREYPGHSGDEDGEDDEAIQDHFHEFFRMLGRNMDEEDGESDSHGSDDGMFDGENEDRPPPHLLVPPAGYIPRIRDALDMLFNLERDEEEEIAQVDDEEEEEEEEEAAEVSDEYEGSFIDDNEHHPLVRVYEDDGSRSGPASRLLRFLQERRYDEDEAGEDEDEDQDEE